MFPWKYQLACAILQKYSDAFEYSPILVTELYFYYNHIYSGIVQNIRSIPVNHMNMKGEKVQHYQISDCLLSIFCKSQTSYFLLCNYLPLPLISHAPCQSSQEGRPEIVQWKYSRLIASLFCFILQRANWWYFSFGAVCYCFHASDWSNILFD